MKTVRFSKVVAASGKPEFYTLWLPPEKDRDFQAALKGHRVMTVRQENVGTKADLGEIGFIKAERASFLLFPKSLKRFEGCRVVGIKYDLLEESARAENSQKSEKPKKAARASKPKPAQAKPAVPAKLEPLKVYQPEETSKPKKTELPAKKAEPVEVRDEGAQIKALRSEVRKALKKLEQGNAVAAFQILGKAIEVGS